MVRVSPLCLLLSSALLADATKLHKVQRVQKAAAHAATAIAIHLAAPGRTALAAPTTAAIATKQKQETLGAPRPKPDAADADSTAIDLRAVPGVADLSKKIASPGFLFSEKLGPVGELEEELQECEYETVQRGGSGFGKQFVTLGATAATLYYGAKGLTAIERWFKLQEMRDIEAEIEMSGQYISVDAGDVESSIDPTTGRNITIASARSGGAGNATANAEAGALPAWLPGWLRNVLEAAPTEEEFFDKTTLPGMASKKGKMGKATEAEGGDASADGSDDGSPALDDISDDTDGLDTLDGLLGGGA